MKNLVIVVIVALLITAICAFAGSNITGQFSVDGTTIKQRQSGELYTDTAVVTSGLATSSSVTSAVGVVNTRLTNYTTSTNSSISGVNTRLTNYTTATNASISAVNAKFNNSSSGYAVCWKSAGILGFCSTTPTDGACTCN